MFSRLSYLKECRPCTSSSFYTNTTLSCGVCVRCGPPVASLAHYLLRAAGGEPRTLPVAGLASRAGASHIICCGPRLKSGSLAHYLLRAAGGEPRNKISPKFCCGGRNRTGVWRFCASECFQTAWTIPCSHRELFIIVSEPSQIF